MFLTAGRGRDCGGDMGEGEPKRWREGEGEGKGEGEGERGGERGREARMDV